MTSEDLFSVIPIITCGFCASCMYVGVPCMFSRLVLNGLKPLCLLLTHLTDIRVEMFNRVHLLLDRCNCQFQVSLCNTKYVQNVMLDLLWYCCLNNRLHCFGYYVHKNKDKHHFCSENVRCPTIICLWPLFQATTIMLCSLLVVIKKITTSKPIFVFLLVSDHMCVIFVQTLAMLYYFCLFIVNSAFWLTI